MLPLLLLVFAFGCGCCRCRGDWTRDDPCVCVVRVAACSASQVKLVYHAATKRTFAMKILQKVQIQQLRQQANIMNERDLMMKIDHPFILKLYDTYKDRDRLYMLLELVQVRGGGAAV